MNLVIWKRSRELVKEVYLISRRFPSEEKFGLISQVRRAAVSVPSNIAEGCGRGSDGQLRFFLNVSIGSLCELETQLYLSYDLNFITEADLERLIKEITEIRKMTQSIRMKLK